MNRQFSAFRRKMQLRGRRVTPLLMESEWSAPALSIGRFLEDLLSQVKNSHESERAVLQRFVTWQIPSGQYEHLLISSGLRQSMRSIKRESLLLSSEPTGSETDDTSQLQLVSTNQFTDYCTSAGTVRSHNSSHLRACAVNRPSYSGMNCLSNAQNSYQQNHLSPVILLPMSPLEVAWGGAILVALSQKPPNRTDILPVNNPTTATSLSQHVSPMSKADSANVGAPSNTTAGDGFSQYRTSQSRDRYQEEMSQEADDAGPSRLNAIDNFGDTNVLAGQNSSAAGAGIIQFMRATKVTWTLQAEKLTMTAKIERKGRKNVLKRPRRTALIKVEKTGREEPTL